MYLEVVYSDQKPLSRTGNIRQARDLGYKLSNKTIRRRGICQRKCRRDRKAAFRTDNQGCSARKPGTLHLQQREHCNINEGDFAAFLPPRGDHVAFV
jgi:hypothetical protein